MPGFKLMLIWLMQALAGITPKASYQPQITTHYDEVEQAVVADNLEPAPYTLSVTFTDFVNAKSSCYPSCLVVAPPGRSKLFGLRAKQTGEVWRSHYNFRFHLGDYRLKPNARFVYTLPFAGARQVSQGYNGTFTHFGDERYSLDFPMPEGTPVYAARAGKVVWVVQKYSEGGTEERLKPFANVIQVLHADGTIARYVHLRQNGAVVKLGQEVVAGQQLGFSGNTGYTTQPHLHFEVRYNHGGERLESIPTLFHTSEGDMMLRPREAYARP